MPRRARNTTRRAATTAEEVPEEHPTQTPETAVSSTSVRRSSRKSIQPERLSMDGNDSPAEAKKQRTFQPRKRNASSTSKASKKGDLDLVNSDSEEEVLSDAGPNVSLNTTTDTSVSGGDSSSPMPVVVDLSHLSPKRRRTELRKKREQIRQAEGQKLEKLKTFFEELDDEELSCEYVD